MKEKFFNWLYDTIMPLFLFFFGISISNDLLCNSKLNIIDFSNGITDVLEVFSVLIKSFISFKFVMNFVVYTALYSIIYSIINRKKYSCIIVGVLSMIFGIINYITFMVRGVGVSVSDIYSIKTAKNVSEHIRLDINIFFVLSIVVFIISLVLSNKFLFGKNIVETKNNIKQRLKSFFIGIGVLAIIVFPISLISVNLWNTNSAYTHYGTGITLVRMTGELLSTRKPHGYDKEKVENILKNVGNKESIIASENELPNVLIVMNESFSNLEEVYDIEMKREPIPFFKEISSRDNVISGNLHSSTFSSGTANCEYELLTSNTTAFLPLGSLVYQQYIRKDVNESLVNTLNELGYNSFGMHSWYGDGYRRKKIYDNLKFKNKIFVEDMKNMENLECGFPSDISTYEQYFKIMEDKPSGEHNFSFILTMQNHLPYHKDAKSQDNEYIDSNDTLDVYLQRLRLSDDALRKLIDFLENYEEDTILLFLGDHQPNVIRVEDDNYDEEDFKYIVPFFIWANYDIDGKKGIETSCNYIQLLLLDAMGIEKSEYMYYIEELRKELPIITVNYYIDKNGKKYKIKDKKSPYYDKIKEYECVSYYQLFE